MQKENYNRPTNIARLSVLVLFLLVATAQIADILVRAEEMDSRAGIAILTTIWYSIVVVQLALVVSILMAARVPGRIRKWRRRRGIERSQMRTLRGEFKI